MTRFITNRIKVFHKYVRNVKVVSYDNLGEKVYSAQKVQRVLGIFFSEPVEGDRALVSWKEATWTGSKVDGTDVALYVRTAATESSLETNQGSISLYRFRKEYAQNPLNL